MSTIRSIGFVIALGFVLAGCAASGTTPAASRGTPEAAYATLSDANASIQKRTGAIATLLSAAQTGATSPDAARAALKRIAWSWHQGTPPLVRIAAIDALLSDEANLDDTHNMLKLMTPTEQQREVLEHVCMIASERHWRDMTPAIVRSWSRSVPGWEDMARPEAKALTALWPDQDHDAVLFDVFTGAEGAEEKARSAAWALLTRLDKDGVRTRELVQHRAPELEASGDVLATAIGRAWRELHVVPLTPEQLEWTRRLFEAEHDADRRAYVAAMEGLSDEQVAGLALRHGPLLAWAQAQHPDWLESSRDALVEQVLQGLGRTRAYGPGARSAAQDLAEASWLDVLTAAAAVHATHDPDVVYDLFQQADADQIDRSTEHGGVIEPTSDGAWRAVSFPPRPTERFGDRQFVASDDMIKRGDTALFHYHFHVQDHSNRNYAVPSGGDYETAQRLGRASLVFTFIDRDHLNVDLYFPSGKLIDLGAIERPQ
ncbi:MAG: hypothetical protein KDA20_08455 [Phycisphaerales bacterium]|nr:hypothetical protein [Phycisphaerales bacterium]